MSRVLLVEDDEGIGRGLVSSLSANGHDVDWQRTGASALHAVELTAYDLVLLDLGLPDLDGVDVCRGVKRARPDCVVVMLTARTDEMDVVVGLEAGADDYLVKPFRTTELLARVRAHLRRQTPRPDTPLRLAVGDLVVDVQARRCLLGGREVALRPKELDLLVCLLAAAGSALSRTRLMSEVWDENWVGSTKTLDVHIASLRQRLAAVADEADPSVRLPEITTLRGFGYRLERADSTPTSG
ncbi:MAG: response regulator transcription factor [Nocardioides sp.]